MRTPMTYERVIDATIPSQPNDRIENAIINIKYSSDCRIFNLLTLLVNTKRVNRFDIAK